MLLAGKLRSHPAYLDIHAAVTQTLDDDQAALLSSIITELRGEADYAGHENAGFVLELQEGGGAPQAAAAPAPILSRRASVASRVTDWSEAEEFVAERPLSVTSFEDPAPARVATFIDFPSVAPPPPPVKDSPTESSTSSNGYHSGEAAAVHGFEEEEREAPPAPAIAAAAVAAAIPREEAVAGAPRGAGFAAMLEARGRTLRKSTDQRPARAPAVEAAAPAEEIDTTAGGVLKAMDVIIPRMPLSLGSSNSVGFSDSESDAS